MKVTYQIEFFDYWHTGSGLSGSTYADALVNKRDGLPIIPGRTLKGLLRDAATQLQALGHPAITEAFITKVFGEAPKVSTKEVPIEEDAERREIAVGNFSNALLSESLASLLLSKPTEKELKAGEQESMEKEKLQINQTDQSLLYHLLSSTRIDDNGIAVDYSLRQIEVIIPLTLYAQIAHFPEEAEALAALKTCMKWIKRMGVNRTRGLGRCRFSIC